MNWKKFDKQELLTSVDKLNTLSKKFIFLFGIDDQNKETIHKFWLESISVDDFMRACHELSSMGLEKKLFIEREVITKQDAFLQEALATRFGDKKANEVTVKTTKIMNKIGNCLVFLRKIIESTPENDQYMWRYNVIRYLLLHLTRQDAIQSLKKIIDKISDESGWR